MFDVPSGEMLAMVSMPAYDPNSFSDGIAISNGRCCRTTTTCR
ncbi:hypothetical protein AB5I41_29390 [Sphingomonas sp. MMS24-JH45]